MNRDYDDDGQLIRMCTPCMEILTILFMTRISVKLNVYIVVATIPLSRNPSGTGSSVTSAEQHLGGCNER